MTIVQCPNCKIKLTSSDMPFSTHCPYCGKPFPVRTAAGLSATECALKRKRLRELEADIGIIEDTMKEVNMAYISLRQMAPALSKQTVAIILDKTITSNLKGTMGAPLAEIRAIFEGTLSRLKQDQQALR